MFRYIFRLQAQDFTLAAIPAAVKQDIYLLHEISPKLVRIRVSRIHEFVDAGQFNFVILFQLDIENGPRLRWKIQCKLPPKTKAILPPCAKIILPP